MNQLSDVDFFYWNNVHSSTYGIRVLNQPSPVLAKERLTSITVPGRSGTLTMLEGANVYEDVTITVTCALDKPHEGNEGADMRAIEKICGWLRGEGGITFANRLDGYYKARIANQISFDQILRGNPHRIFQIQFVCKPFFYLASGLPRQEFFTSPTRIENPGNIPSEPLIRINGTGEITLMNGFGTMLVDTSGHEYIILDCEAKLAYRGDRTWPGDPLVLMGTRVTGEWLTIPTGASFFSWSGPAGTVLWVTPRWRCIV